MPLEEHCSHPQASSWLWPRVWNCPAAHARMQEPRLCISRNAGALHSNGNPKLVCAWQERGLSGRSTACQGTSKHAETREGQSCLCPSHELFFATSISAADFANLDRP